MQPDKKRSQSLEFTQNTKSKKQATKVAPGNLPKQPQKVKNNLWSKLNTRLIAIVIVAILIIVGIFTYNHFHSANQIKNGKGSSDQSQINIVVEKVGKLILLPSGEQPTMAIINDASKLNSSPFFKNVANGDRLIIYAQARQVIVYRPSINKIIAVGPLDTNPQPTTKTGQ